MLSVVSVGGEVLLWPLPGAVQTCSLGDTLSSPPNLPGTTHTKQSPLHLLTWCIRNPGHLHWVPLTTSTRRHFSRMPTAGFQAGPVVEGWGPSMVRSKWTSCTYPGRDLCMVRGGGSGWSIQLTLEHCSQWWTKPLNDDLFVTVTRSNKLVNRTAYGSKVSARHVINFLSVDLPNTLKKKVNVSFWYLCYGFNPLFRNMWR